MFFNSHFRSDEGGGGGGGGDETPGEEEEAAEVCRLDAAVYSWLVTEERKAPLGLLRFVGGKWK